MADVVGGAWANAAIVIDHSDRPSCGRPTATSAASADAVFVCGSILITMNARWPGLCSYPGGSTAAPRAAPMRTENRIYTAGVD